MLCHSQSCLIGGLLILVRGTHSLSSTTSTGATTTILTENYFLSTSSSLTNSRVNRNTATHKNVNHAKDLRRNTCSTLWSLSSGEFEREEDIDPKAAAAADVPTQTMASRLSTPPAEPKPKVVVLGATGGIGRRIVKQLMEVDLDMDVVAFVRDYDKACEVLYDDSILIQREGEGKGPRLRLVVGNLIPPSEVFGYNPEEDDDEEEEDDDDYAISAARFYENDISEYQVPPEDLDPNEALKEAIKGATVIISAVGTVRPTNLWTDCLTAPWRIFQSPAKWCKDRTHPYYVNHYAQKKLMQYASKEQLQRQSAWEEYYQEQKEFQEEARSRGYHVEVEEPKMKEINRIRFIRISDLCVTQPTYGFVTVFTNIVRSLVFREQFRGEHILQKTKEIDTIILRPGDLTDEIRNTTTTSLQVNCDGILPQPALVGRDDVAALAVSAALTKLDLESNTKRPKKGNLYSEVNAKDSSLNNRISNSKLLRRTRRNSLRKKRLEMRDAKHFTIAVRWATTYLMQGEKKDGLPNAQTCMNHVVKEESKKLKRKRRQIALRNTSPLQRLLSPISKKISRGKEKYRPYSLFVAIPIYVMLSSIFISLWKVLPGRKALEAILVPYIKQGGFILLRYLKVLLSLLQKGKLNIPRLFAP